MTRGYSSRQMGRMVNQLLETYPKSGSELARQNYEYLWFKTPSTAAKYLTDTSREVDPVMMQRSPNQAHYLARVSRLLSVLGAEEDSHLVNTLRQFFPSFLYPPDGIKQLGKMSLENKVTGLLPGEEAEAHAALNKIYLARNKKSI